MQRMKSDELVDRIMNAGVTNKRRLEKREFFCIINTIGLAMYNKRNLIPIPWVMN